MTVAALALAVALLSAPAPMPGDQFFAQLKTLCGRTFLGQVAAGDPADEVFRASELVMTVNRCEAEEVRIGFRVETDASRTWVITRLAGGRLRLKHDHRHADGHEDALSQYGGATLEPGTPTLQRFPVDAESKALFTRLDRAASNTNVWSLGLTTDRFSYELARPGRLFRVAFDLTRPAPASPTN